MAMSKQEYKGVTIKKLYMVSVSNKFSSLKKIIIIDESRSDLLHGELLEAQLLDGLALFP